MAETCNAVPEGAVARKPSEVDALVGRRLKLRRVLLNMSQQDVADYCAISAQQIHKYEKGESRITASRLVQFGEVLGVPVSWFFVDIERHPELPDDLLRLVAVQVLAAAIALLAARRGETLPPRSLPARGNEVVCRRWRTHSQPQTCLR